MFEGWQFWKIGNRRKRLIDFIFAALSAILYVLYVKKHFDTN